MNIISGQKKLMLLIVVLVVIGGAAAYIFLDPFAGKASPSVAAPKPQPRAAKPAEKTPAPAVAAPTADKPGAATVVAGAETGAPAKEALSLKLSDSVKKPAKLRPVSPPTADLRHCLEQPTNLEIAKCAGE